MPEPTLRCVAASGQPWPVVDELTRWSCAAQGLVPACPELLAAGCLPRNVVLVARLSLVAVVVQRFNLDRWPLTPFWEYLLIVP